MTINVINIQKKDFRFNFVDPTNCFNCYEGLTQNYNDCSDRVRIKNLNCVVKLIGDNIDYFTIAQVH